MSKRFTATEKWEDPWFRALKPNEKLIFLYLTDKCDIAGFYEIDIEMMSFQIGVTKENIEGAIKGLERGLKGDKDGKWLWVKNFLKHQKYIPLSPKNNIYPHLIESLRKNSVRFDLDYLISIIGNDINGVEGGLKGLISPKGIGIGKGKGKGIGIGGGMGEDKKFIPPTIEEFKIYFKENGFPENLAERVFKSYDVANWHKANGEAIKNWKQTCQQVWFKEEHKNFSSKPQSAAPTAYPKFVD